MKPSANKRKQPASGREQLMRVKIKKKKAPQAQHQSAHPVYTKRQKSRRHRKVRPYSEPEGADEGWSPALAGVRTDLPPGEVEGDRFLPASLREIMWLKKIAGLTPNQRRKYLKSRRRTNPEVGDVAGMRRDTAHRAALRRKKTESQGRFLARVERTAQQALLASQYADRFGSPASANQGKRKQKKQRHTSGNDSASARGSGSAPTSWQKPEAAATFGERQLSPAEKKQIKQKRRDLATQRPGRLEPVASEPPKVLARIKFNPQRKGSAKFAAAAAAFSSGGRGGGSVSAIDRRLLLT